MAEFGMRCYWRCLQKRGSVPWCAERRESSRTGVKMAVRHFLRDDDISAEEQRTILQAAMLLAREPRAAVQALSGSSVGLFFEKPSLRTRVSCEAACVNLGAHPIQLRAEELQLKRRETPLDTARVLAGYISLLVGRVYQHKLLEEIAEARSMPVVNGLSEMFHPLQSLADLLTLYQEWGGDLRGRKLVYLGDGNNVCRSLAVAGVMAGMHFITACPRHHRLSGDILPVLRYLSEKHGGSFSQADTPRQAACGADVLYTDVWSSMGDEAEESDRVARFAAYQLNEELLSVADENAVVLHCLPAHRDEEISAGVLDGAQSRIVRQAHNRLPATAALFLFLLAPEICENLAKA
ncbi:MAG: ornithine carbamoyltransferase [Proteobacteria bacterium]|nr:MAG: ornithine carbamoyltransferase [Pseudomonadota bacterium]